MAGRRNHRGGVAHHAIALVARASSVRRKATTASWASSSERSRERKRNLTPTGGACNRADGRRLSRRCPNSTRPTPSPRRFVRARLLCLRTIGVRREFAALPVGALRARVLTTAVPPTGVARRADQVGAEEELERPFACDVCSAHFATLVSTTMHKFSAHNAVRLPCVLEINNQCFLCDKVFSTLEICKRGVIESWSSGRCGSRSTVYPHAVLFRTHV